jgi:methionyl-tRNA synthetase
MENKEKFYITTAIAYASGKPHIGNTYEIVLADSIARFMRLYGYDVYFQTGADEHGIKIETKAAEEGMDPKDYVDKTSNVMKGIWDVMGTSYDSFVRTTEPIHMKKVQQIFKKLYDQGDIYKGEYEGMYCAPCESFFTPSQLVDGKCPECGREVTYAKEDAYFLKLEKYADRLVEHINSNPDFIRPDSRKHEMINNFINPGLRDLCVSRTSVKWGIPVDFDPDHVVYVWIDALSNYVTFLGYDTEGEHGKLFNKYWPCDIHLIGKDILRFHTIYWPIILMALDMELPKTVFGHPWLLVGEDKMSKSKGNVVYADDLVYEYGLDTVRYYMLREMPFSADGTFTYDLLTERINTDLANTLGNLVSRTIAMTEQYFDLIVPEKTGVTTQYDEEFLSLINETPVQVAAKMHEYRVSDAISLIFALLRRANKYIDETTPWILARDEEKKPLLGTVLYNLLDCIRIAAALLGPYIPETSQKIIKSLGTKRVNWEDLKAGELESGITLTKLPTVLFERIKPDKEESPKSKPLSAEEEITMEEFSKVQLRVGKIISARKHKNADKLLVFEVSLGDDEPLRQIVSGIADEFTPEELVGKLVTVVANLKSVKLRGEVSQGMLLLSEDNEKLSFIVPENQVTIGSIIK